jgi:hypothetical protein
MKAHLVEMERAHKEEMDALKVRLQNEWQEKERQHTQKLLAINNEHGRKEQSYKEVIERLMAALTMAQKKHQAL